MIEVSVIVPIYNAEKYLHKCIDSLIEQSFLDYEILLIDDGSTDSSGEICDKYMEVNKIIKVFHQENRGVSSARNCGIKNAMGKYIMFVDSDDYIDKEMIKRHHEMMEEHVDLTVSSFETICDKSIGKTFMPNDLYTSKRYMDDMSKGVFREMCAGVPWGKMFRKAILDTHDIRFIEGVSLGEDTCFNMEYLRYCRNIATSEDVLYSHVIQNSDSLGSKFHEESYEWCKMAFEYRVKTLQIVGCTEETYNRFVGIYINYIMGNVIKSIRKSSKESAINVIKKAKKDEYLLKGETLSLPKKSRVLWLFIKNGKNIGLVRFVIKILSVIYYKLK